MVHTTGRFGENLSIQGIRGCYSWPVLGHTFDYLTDTHAFGRKMRARYGEVYQLEELDWVFPAPQQLRRSILECDRCLFQNLVDTHDEPRTI